MGLFTVGIDPCPDATCRNDVDAFEIVGGQDFEGTCRVVEKHHVDAIITTATDKPLVMMARIAEKYRFPFFSVDTARWSTDKFLMKQKFLEGGIPCAKGRLIHSAEEAKDFTYPVIVKPRDNSGSRGVKLCNSEAELQECISEALQYSHCDTILAEEYIEGQEYSIESLHYNGRSEVIQYTEKKTSEYPYNVELGHIQPANLSDKQKDAVCEIIEKIDKALKFENCPSHTELKINNRGIFVIETSPRLGGDFITSILVPFSTGFNMEDNLLHIALGEKVTLKVERVEKASGICFLNLPCGKVASIDSSIEDVKIWPDVYSFETSLKVGDEIHPITSSLNRYGQFIVIAHSHEEIERLIETYNHKINSFINVTSK